MACRRLNCGNILCSKLILEGSCYVCDSCHAELKLYGEVLKREGTEPTRRVSGATHVVNGYTMPGALPRPASAREAIKRFLDTTPGAFLPSDEAAEAFAVEFDRLVAGD